ncbi:MAG: hypothetical protein QNJ94_06835 [Alphaproteobacteria bacterium]|nr:hypothetical protein [Alphaproteobacteria bacterium]
MSRLILVIAFTALTACASEPHPTMFDRWVYASCWQDEEITGVTFEECLDDLVARFCTEQGHQPETPAYRRCDKDARKIAFLQNQYKLLRNSQKVLF